MKKLLILIFVLCFISIADASRFDEFNEMDSNNSGGSGCTTFACLTGTPTTIAGYGLTGVVQPYSANTMVSSATPTDAHITKFNAATGLYDDAGALVNTGTGVPAAAAINIGTAGSFVVNGGALGTPSSGNIGNTTGLKDQLSFTFDSGGAAVLATTQKPAKTYRSYAITSFDSWVIDCDLGNTDSTPIIINLAQKVRTAATSGAIPVIATNNMCATTYRPIGNSSTPIAQGAWACATTATAADTNFAAYIVQAPTTSTHCTLIVNVTR